MGKNTYVAVGNKEDLGDLISNIAPQDTPLYSMLGKGTATATLHEWLEDSLPSPGDNKQVEGFEYTVTDPAPRVRLGNYTQIMTRGYGVTKTQEKVQKHGVSSEIAYQMTKAMKALAFDMEQAIITQATKNAGTASVARQFGGIPHWITTNKLANGGTARVISESLIADALQAAWVAGGHPTTLVCSGGQKRKISAFTNGVQKTMDAAVRKLTQVIDVFESDFGLVKIVADRWMPDTSIFVLDPTHWKVCALRPFGTQELPNTGDNLKKVIVGEHTMEARAEKASASIVDLKL